MSRCLCGKHGPRSEMVTRKLVGKSQEGLFTQMWIGRSNQIAVHAKEKAPKGLS